MPRRGADTHGNCTWSSFFTYFRHIYNFFKVNAGLRLVIKPHQGICKLHKQEIIRALQVFADSPNICIEAGNIISFLRGSDEKFCVCL